MNAQSKIPRLVCCTDNVNVQCFAFVHDAIHFFEELVFNADFAANLVRVVTHKRI